MKLKLAQQASRAYHWSLIVEQANVVGSKEHHQAKDRRWKQKEKRFLKAVSRRRLQKAVAFIVPKIISQKEV
jgi:hypothetical protein